MVSLKLFCLVVTVFTVKLIPSMVIEPLGMTNLINSSGS